MRVLIGCEYSAVVRDAFRAQGHNAWSVDLLPTEGDPTWHIQDDLFHVVNSSTWSTGMDLFIAHWPCTNMANSGVRWLWNQDGSRNEERWERMESDAQAFRSLLRVNASAKVLENPIMHRHARLIVGRGPTQIIQPWMFGHGETKATCLWLENLPKLVPTNIVSGREARVHRMPPGKNRWKERSRTLQGIASAMADQWGGSLVNNLV